MRRPARRRRRLCRGAAARRRRGRVPRVRRHDPRLLRHGAGGRRRDGGAARGRRRVPPRLRLIAPAVGDALPQRTAGPPIGLGALFFGFLKVSLCGFGGPVLWARRILVDRQRWFDDREFAELLSFCQFLPGPNIVSLSVCVGARFRGAAGALAALAGYILVPWSLGFALAALYLSY